MGVKFGTEEWTGTTLELGPTSRKFCVIGQNTHFLRIVYSLSIFSIGNVTTACGDVPKFGAVFSAFIVDERHIFCLSIC